MQLILQLTRSCNFACSYCYQTHRSGPGMAPEVAERAVLRLLDEGHAHVAVTWFGGEPLLERETIEATLPRLSRVAARRGALITSKLSTNGALLDEDFCRFARRHALFVSLSADGGPRVQDRGRRTGAGGPPSHLSERALSILSATRTPFCTYQVIRPESAPELARSVDWLFERGSRILLSTLDFGADWDEGSLAALAAGYRALARRYARWTERGVDFHLSPFDGKIALHTRGESASRDACAAGVRQIAVDPQGYIYPCIEFLESEELRIGHVDRGIDRKALEAVLARYGGGRPSECGECGIQRRCGSACACLNLRLTGRMNGIDALLCAHERMVTLAADRIGARLWKRKSRAFLDRQYDPHHHALSAVESLFDEVLNG